MRRALAAMVASVLLAGCSPVSPETAARARDLRLGINGAPFQIQLTDRPSGMSPFAPTGSAEQRLALIQFAPLASGRDGGIVPGVIDAWEVAPDGRSVILTWKRKSWSDGHALTPQDVVASLEAHLDPRARSAYANQLLGVRGAREFRSGAASSVSGVVALGWNRVQVSLAEQDPHFVDHLIQIPVLPAHVYPTREAMITADYRMAPVASGPFVVDRWEPDGSVVFRPNPTSKLKPATGLVARPVAPEAVPTEFTAGRLDVADAHRMRPETVPAGVRLETAPGNTLLTLTPVSPRVADPRVRRALLHALDRQALVSTQLQGRGRVADSVLFQTEWTEAEPHTTYPHDPELAGRLLAEAGWDPARRLRMRAPSGGDEKLWRAVADQLNAAGIGVDLVVHDPSEQSATGEEAQADLVAGSWRAPLRRPSGVSSLVACGGSRETNVGGYCNPQLDDRVREATAASTQSEEIIRWRQVNDILHAELPVLPVVVPDISLATTTTMGRIDPTVVPITGLLAEWMRVA